MRVANPFPAGGSSDGPGRSICEWESFKISVRVDLLPCKQYTPR